MFNPRNPFVPTTPTAAPRPVDLTGPLAALPVSAPPPNPPATATAKKYSVDLVWTPKLAKRFTAVSAYFLANLHRIGGPGSRGLTPSEAMVIIQLLSFKWDDRAPKPALRTIATRLGLSVRTVRDIVKRLEDLHLVQREHNSEGGCNRYHFDGLFAHLEQLMDSDANAADAAERDDEKAVA